LVQHLKGMSSRRLMIEGLEQEDPGLTYLASTLLRRCAGDVLDEVVMKYIEQQEVGTPDSEFMIERLPE
jgi:hypothetical protein